MSRFPLQKVSEHQLQQLCQGLWSWQVCDDCKNSKCCSTEDCPSQRSKQLARYFEYYRELTALYEPEIRLGEEPALASHEDVFAIIRHLKNNPDTPRNTLEGQIFAGQHVAPSERERAISLTVRVMIMVSCSPQRQSAGLLEHGINQVPWRSDLSFAEFMTSILPVTDHPSINDEEAGSSLDLKKELKAEKLKKNAGLEFRPTDDLRRHLKLDRDKGLVEIYHHTAFLKEHLRRTKDIARPLTVSEALTMGVMPRQLALEALDSIQKILFPSLDPKSRSLLLSLISISAFDPDCVRFESIEIRNPDEKDISYHHFGARLAELYEELANPTPRGRIEKWFHRKSAPRHLMMATLVGVLIAVLLGIASLAVGGYQAWISYQQWQHPVGGGNGWNS